MVTTEHTNASLPTRREVRQLSLNWRLVDGLHIQNWIIDDLICIKVRGETVFFSTVYRKRCIMDKYGRSDLAQKHPQTLKVFYEQNCDYPNKFFNNPVFLRRKTTTESFLQALRPLSTPSQFKHCLGLLFRMPKTTTKQKTVTCGFILSFIGCPMKNVPSLRSYWHEIAEVSSL